MEALGSLALPILFIGVLYLLLIRPQQKRTKEHRAAMSKLAVGDDIITIGGLHGRIASLTDETMDLEVTDDVLLRYQRSSLAKVVNEPEDDVTVDTSADDDADETAEAAADDEDSRNT